MAWSFWLSVSQEPKPTSESLSPHMPSRRYFMAGPWIIPSCTMRPRGHQLSTDLLLSAYRRGWFPMADPLTGAVRWYHPDPRAIVPLDEFHVPRNLAREVRRGRFEIRCDTAFEQVMRACAAPRPDDDQTWIDDRLVEAYVGLHRAVHAHSVEAWHDERLVGGLYGVHVDGAFMGESMFCRP